MSKAVVFAYHSVGVRCLRVLLHYGVDVALVVTHADDAGENVWFDSVQALCAERGLACHMDDGDDAALLAQVQALTPDVIFSFYFRRLLPAPLLDLARIGSFNLHGSLLPQYAGRAPVNWAVLHGESQTGATLHLMTAKADAGDIVQQVAVPILEDDNAQAVFDKVTLAAESCLFAALPGILRNDFPRHKQDPSLRSYFGRRGPQDGRIDWRWPARQIHNLVRAVAPPYPGAFCQTALGLLAVHRTRVLTKLDAAALAGSAPMLASSAPQVMYVVDMAQQPCLLVRCADGHYLQLLSGLLNGQPLSPQHLTSVIPAQGLALL